MDKIDEKTLLVNVQEGAYLLKQEEIVFLEASSNYTRLHLVNNKTITSAHTLKKYQGQLAGKDFIRVHSSFLVNKNHILFIDTAKKVFLSNKLAVRVAKRRWKTLQDKMLSGYKII